MELCYIGILYPPESDYYTNCGNDFFLQTSTSKFCFNQIVGLEKNYNKRFKVISVPWIPYYPGHSIKEVKTKKWSYKNDNILSDIEIGFRNIRGVKIIDQYKNLIKELCKWISETPTEDHIVFGCTITFAMLLAVYRLKIKYPHIRVCWTVVDLPGRESCEYKPGIKGFLSIIVSIVDKLFVKKFDAFVFLTKEMALRMKIKDKPYVVIEGFAKEFNSNNETRACSDNIAMIAGRLNYNYDIMPIVKLFCRKSMKKYQLWLAGDGDATDEIKDIVKMEDNIKYFGYISPDKVEKLQNQATILINPRRNNHRYIKYSFPGKTFECLCSGKPYLAFKLDCMNNEYDEYIIYFNEDNESIEKTIKKVFNLSLKERSDIANKAKNWVLKNKNPSVQCKKIKEMMELYYG